MSKITTYSKKISGDDGNYGWVIQFDRTGSYIGISQWDEGGELKDRVLLSYKQRRALLEFLKQPIRRTL